MTTLRQLVREQDGIVSRRQLLVGGVSRHAIEHRLTRSRRWRKVLPGVYATFTGPLAHRHRLRAALLWGGPEAQLTGPTAATLWRLRYAPDDPTSVHVLVPERRHLADREFVKVSRTTRLPSPPFALAGLPVVLPARAVVDTCRYLRRLQDVRAMLCESVQRGLADVEELRRELDEGHSAGSALARRALADAVAGCRSAPECELRDLFATSSIVPEALWNVPLAGASVVPDCRWPQARLVVEVDSAEWHRFGAAPERTERRRAMLASLGWTVLPVSPRRLREDPAGVLAQVERAYLAGLARVAR